MKKQLSLVKVDPLALSALHVERFHRMAMLHANQSVAAAILAGAELNSVKAQLREKTGHGGFLSWFEAHENDLGFSVRTKDNYMSLASKVRQALPKDIAALLDFAPSELKAEQQKRLMTALVKKADGATLSELYLDYGVTKAPRKEPVNRHPDKNKSAQDEPAKEATPDLLIQDELFKPIDALVEWWSKPLKVGRKDVPLWEHIEKPKLREYVGKLEDMLADAREALKKK